MKHDHDEQNAKRCPNCGERFFSELTGTQKEVLLGPLPNGMESSIPK